MNGVQGLANYIADTVTSLKNKQSGVVSGKMCGTSTVLIGGTYYPVSVAVDVPAADGDYVCCMLNEAKTVAVVVGA